MTLSLTFAVIRVVYSKVFSVHLRESCTSERKMKSLNRKQIGSCAPLEFEEAALYKLLIYCVNQYLKSHLDINSARTNMAFHRLAILAQVRFPNLNQTLIQK